MRWNLKAVVLDLSKYFDTLNHTILLRKQVKDERVTQMVKRYLKSGVMENGVVTETEEGSSQGGNLSLLLANVYLNEFDWEFHRRNVPCIHYADDIVLLAKNGKGTYIRVHGKTWRKAKEKLRQLTSRSRCRSIIRTMEKLKVYMRGWLTYYGIADMKNNIESLNGWLYRRIRMCIWKQWKLPKPRKRKLMGLG